MKRRILLSTVFLLLFTMFSREIQSGRFRNFDFAMSVKIQERIDKSPRLRTAELVGNIMEGSTFLASPAISVAAVLILTGYAIMRGGKNQWKSSKSEFQTPNETDRPHTNSQPSFGLRWQGVLIPISFFLLVMAEVYGKSVVHHPAPPFFMIKNPTTIFPKYYINDEYSYPSGHAARAVFIAITTYCLVGGCSRGLVGIRSMRGFIISSVLIGYVGLVSVSRVYLGHHWISDVIGGALLGAGMGVGGLSCLTLNGTNRNTSSTPEVGSFRVATRSSRPTHRR